MPGVKSEVNTMEQNNNIPATSKPSQKVTDSGNMQHPPQQQVTQPPSVSSSQTAAHLAATEPPSIRRGLQTGPPRQPILSQHNASQQPRPQMKPNAMSPTTGTPSAAPSYNQGSGAPWGGSSSYLPGRRYPAPNPAAAYGSYTQTYPGQGRTMPTASPNMSQSSSSSMEQLSKTNLYIRGLTPNTTDRDLAAEMAVKALQAKGVQAQMAKQQEQDPTNLYIANLPMYMTETDLENMFSPYGQVISTRILRDNTGISRGVGFCRMESKEKCDQIIQTYNGKILPGHKDALTVKFADGGNKKKDQLKGRQTWMDRPQEQVRWNAEGIALSPYDPAVAPNGVAPTVMTPPNILPRYSMATTPVTTYQLPSGSWLHPATQQYIMQSPMASVLPTSALQQQQDALSAYTLDSSTAAMMMPQLAAQYVTGPHGTYTQMAYPQQHGTPIMHAMTLEDHAAANAAAGPSAALTPEEHHQHFQAYSQATHAAK